jgi:hypothetical protein
VESTSNALLGKVFPKFGKVAEGAAHTLFSAVVRTGSALVTDIAAAMDGDATSKKGRQEKVSGWLARYDFASPVRDHLWREGMEMGYDASRSVVAMGHSLLCAAVVLRRRAAPLRLALLKGRKGLLDAETALFDAIVGAVGDNGIPVHDRGFDSGGFIAHAIRSGHRSVVRIKTMTRDLFGSGRGFEQDMSDIPHVRTVLSSPTRRVDAVVGWKMGSFPVGDSHQPVLVVSSSFGGSTLYLYALNFVPQDATPDAMQKQG